jgi:hypothetical protein
MRCKSGQSLVELALALPVALLIVMAGMQLVFMARTRLALTGMAAEVARSASIGGNTQATFGWEYGRLSAWDARRHLMSFGFFLPTVSLQSRPIPRWRAYSGIHTLADTARLVTVDVGYYLRSRSILRWALPGRSLHVSAELPTEPLVPQERGS